MNTFSRCELHESGFDQLTFKALSDRWGPSREAMMLSLWMFLKTATHSVGSESGFRYPSEVKSQLASSLGKYIERISKAAAHSS